MQIYDLFSNNLFDMAEIMTTMVIVGEEVIQVLRLDNPDQYLIGGLTTYGEYILVSHKHMIWLVSLL